MDEVWERAVEAALEGQADSTPAPRSLTLDGAVKCIHGRLPPPRLLEKFQSLEHLSIANVGVSSLENFPRLRNLQRLILSDNRIAGGLEFLVRAGLNSLRDLDLSNNRIQFLEDLAPLAQLRLVSLDLYECPITRIKDYRSRVFGMIRSLKYLDKMDADENERPETDDEEEDDEDVEEEDDDPGSGEVDGEDRVGKSINGDGGSTERGGIVDVDENEESDADEEENETGGRSEVNGLGRDSHHLANGFQVAASISGQREDRESEDSKEEEYIEDYNDDEDLGEEINEEEGGDEDVMEVHEIDDSEEEEDGIEQDDEDEDEEEDEEDLEEDVDDDGEDLGSIGRLTSMEGEIDGHEQGEEDENGEIGEEDEQGVDDDRESEDEAGEDERFQRSTLWRLMLGMCWHALHISVSIVHLGSYLFQLLYCSIISSGVLQKYRVPFHKPQCLAIVVDSEEAEDTLKIRSLVQCLSNIGLKQVVLYDMEGVLKKYEASLRKWTTSSMAFPEHDPNTSTLLGDKEEMSLEFLSYSDGKEAIAKAASFLCSKYLKDNNLLGNQREAVFTETDIADTLRTVGCGGPEPALLLVFSPIRCHFGFPSWRLRYTEIVHMGTLKSMKRGAVMKAIYDLSKKQQNYGS